MFLASDTISLPSMTGHVQFHFDSHRRFLAVCEISVPRGISVELCNIEVRHFLRINGNEFILFVPLNSVS